MTDKLKIFLKNFSDFEEQELDRIVGFFKPKSVKKGGILLQEGNVSRAFYYVYTGGIRTFYIDKKGYEKTRYVMLDNEIGTTGCISNCRIALLHVGGEDTAHGGPPRLVGTPAGDNLECALKQDK